VTAGDAQVAAAAVAFVGTHFAMSHPLRAPLVRRVGEGGFLGLYSLVAAATLGWLAWAFVAAGAEAPARVPGDAGWAVASAVMLAASVLLVGSLVGNPALPGPGRPAPEAARGVYAVTRHPMMWAFALWALVHAYLIPTPRNHILTAAILVLALGGAWAQDRKKERLQPDRWPAWEARTSFVPFVAIARGRARMGGLRAHDLGGGLVVWLAATWAHLPIAGWAAGVWRWIA
jgi:uncharacterized membrane protein